MATNFIQEGLVIPLTAPTGGIKSGEGRMFGALFGVAMFDATEGASVEVSTSGVWLLGKPNSVVAFSAGERVFWDDAMQLCKKSAAGFFPIGVATVAAAATDATVSVRLDANSVTAVPGP